MIKTLTHCSRTKLPFSLAQQDGSTPNKFPESEHCFLSRLAQRLGADEFGHADRHALAAEPVWQLCQNAPE